MFHLTFVVASVHAVLTVDNLLHHVLFLVVFMVGFDFLDEWRSLRRGDGCVEFLERSLSGLGYLVFCGRKLSGASRSGALVTLSFETLPSTLPCPI